MYCIFSRVRSEPWDRVQLSEERGVAREKELAGEARVFSPSDTPRAATLAPATLAGGSQTPKGLFLWFGT